MCGIVGYIGHRQAQDILLDGLDRLEYRGYDSAGLATLDDGRIEVRKCVGRIRQLRGLVEERPMRGEIGIGHTRWATHGEPSDLNAHPHTDVKGDIALVHNGIIENHLALRKSLEAQGCAFVSQTDTEAAAHLIHTLYDGDMLGTLRRAMPLLTGNYALAILSEREPDHLFCVRVGSPLVIGLGEGEMFVASDIPAILRHTREVLMLEDREIAVLTRGRAEVYDALGAPVTVRPTHIAWDAAAAEKGGYEHFMLKEIHEQPQAVRGTYEAYAAAGEIKLPLPLAPGRVTFLACGTAYHASLVGGHYLRHLANIEGEARIASEYRYDRIFAHENELALAVSQSGETADTLAALKAAREAGVAVASLTNTVGSTLTRMTPFTLNTFAGPEIAVASTKAYTTQVETLLLLAIALGLKNGALEKFRADQLLTGLRGIPSLMEKTFDHAPRIQKFCDQHMNERLIFFIGRGLDSALAMEAALKLKEVSYLASEAYAAGELKHGAIALISKGTPVIALCTQERLLDKTLSNLRETKSRGANTLCVCPERFAARAREESDEVWSVPDADEMLLPLLVIPPLQMLAYFMAVAQGRDVDKPRNLAKSVTVE